MTTPPDLSTKLKAVNILLAGMGENPIESLVVSQSSLAQKALEALEESSRSLQVKGWYWNSEDNFPLSRASTGEIPLPINRIRVSRVAHSGGDILVERGSRLYNRTDHTFQFPEGEEVRVDLVLYLAWDDIPEFAKQSIIYVAQRRLQMRELTSTAINAAIEDDMAMAMAYLEQAEDAQGPASAITDSPDLAQLHFNTRRR